MKQQQQGTLRFAFDFLVEEEMVRFFVETSTAATCNPTTFTGCYHIERDETFTNGTIHVDDGTRDQRQL